MLMPIQHRTAIRTKSVKGKFVYIPDPWVLTWDWSIVGIRTQNSIAKNKDEIQSDMTGPT